MTKLVKFQLDDDEESFVYMEVNEKLPVSSNKKRDKALIRLGDEVAQS